MALALAIFLCLANGFLLVSGGWSRVRPAWADFLFRASLMVGFGLGVFSVAFLIYRVFEFTSLVAVDLAFFLPLLSATPLLGSRAPSVTLRNPGANKPPRWLRGALASGLALALCAAVYSAIRQTVAHPHGDGWDAFAIWNLHARFLFIDNTHWRDGFTSVLPWSHPDYPLLLPASVAHFWSYLGSEAPAVPAAIGVAFTFATVGTLYAGLALLRGGTHAALAAIFLLSTPSFVEEGTWQYADVPLSFFFLATITLLCLHDEIFEAGRAPVWGLLFVAGTSAGLAAWTKNEGILFVAALLLARQWTFVRLAKKKPVAKKPFMRQTAPFLAGILPVFLVILAFKHWVAPPGDLFSDLHSILQRLLEPLRYWAVFNWYGKEFLRFGNWLLIPGTLLLATLCYGSCKIFGHSKSTSWRVSSLALVWTLAGYALIYLITPYDIYWHLRFSLGRLFLQLWPATIFLIVLSVPSEDRLFLSGAVSK